MTMAQGMAQAAQSSQAGQAQRYILMNLQNQGPFVGGWQATVPTPERMNQVKLLVDSLKLVRPPVPPERAIEVAIQFERKAFQQSATKEAYLNECREKLARIRDQRTAQMQQQQQQGINMQNMAMQQHLAMQQANQAFNQGMNNKMAQLQNNPMQQKMAIQPGQQNLQTPAPAMQDQTQQNRPKPAELTNADQQAINRRAAELARKTSPEEMREILTKMGPEGQQADAMRSQEGGEVVVPASFHQNMRLALRNQQQATAQGQAPIGQPTQAAGQPATSMQMLNRPVTQGQPGLSPQQGPRPTSRAPIPQQISVQEVQRREQFLAQFPLPVQNILRTKPPNEWPGIVNQLRQNTMQRSASQTSQAFGRQQSMQNGPFPVPTTIGTPMQQSLSAGAAPTKPIQAPNESQPIKNEPSAPKPPHQEPNRLAVLSKEQILQMPPEQRAQYREALRRQRNEERSRTVIEFARQLQPKISQLRPLKLDQNVRSQMAARLSAPHVKSMMAHYPQLLANYPDFDPNEADWKKFVEYKFELFAQYQPASVADKTWLPQEIFSITPQRLEMILNELTAKFTQMHSTLYASPALKQEDVKRRKKNPTTPANNAASPVSATQPTAPSPQAIKQQQGPPPTVMFRCPMPSCQQAILGFVSQTELDQHLHIAHMTDINPGTDQLAFLDTTLRDVFNLDENYKPLPQPKTVSMEKTASKSSQPDQLKVESKPVTPSLPTKAPLSRATPTPAEPAMDEEAKVLEEWKAVKIDPEQWNQVFRGWDWEDVVPSSVAHLQSDFIERYQQSEEWKSLLRPASAADTPRDKSTSPPAVAAAAAAAKDEPVTNVDQDDTFVDLSAIDGLNLSGLDEIAEAQATHLDHSASDANGDAIMGNYESHSPGKSSSPFELIDKPDAEALGVGAFLRQHGIDYTRPDQLTSDERRLLDFVMETFDDAAGGKDGREAISDSEWDVDWEQVNAQHEQDVQNRVPGTWTPQGFISEPRKR
ncbi:hypothetical protein DV738_g2428, partial [Chaetothyriales sp. CBS 135597]